MNQILLSFVVPVYNVESYLRECVESLVDCKSELIEVILIDDGSTDNSGMLCDTLSQEYDCVSCIHQKNAGVSTARNVGISVARGKYILFVDADDRMKHGSVSAIVQWAPNANIDICFLQAIDFYPDGKSADHGDSITASGIYGKSKTEVYEYLATRPKFPGSVWAKVFRKSFLENNKILFPPELFSGEDLVFIMNCFLSADSFDALDMPCYEYRRNRVGSATSIVTAESYQQLCRFVVDFSQKLTQNKIAIDSVSSSIMAFVAYEYSVLLWRLNSLEGNARKSAYSFLKQYRWVLRYAVSPRIKAIATMEKVLGIKGTATVLKRYMDKRN